MKNNIEVEAVEEKFCKKCGDPIPSTSKYKKCDNCRRKTAEQRNAILRGVVFVISTIPVARHFIKKG